MPIQVKSDSRVNTDVLRRVWEAARGVTQPGTRSAAGGEGAAALAAKAETASPPAIRGLGKTSTTLKI